MSDHELLEAAAHTRSNQTDARQPGSSASAEELTRIFGTQLRSGWAEAMGLEFTQVSAARVEVCWTVAEQHMQPMGLVHGGVYAGVVETVCSVGAALAAGRGVGIVGIENHTSFLRSARGGLLRAVGMPVQVGRRAQLWNAEVTDTDGRLLARGSLRVMCLPQQ